MCSISQGKWRIARDQDESLSPLLSSPLLSFSSVLFSSHSCYFCLSELLHPKRPSHKRQSKCRASNAKSNWRACASLKCRPLFMFLCDAISCPRWRESLACIFLLTSLDTVSLPPLFLWPISLTQHFLVSSPSLTGEPPLTFTWLKDGIALTDERASDKEGKDFKGSRDVSFATRPGSNNSNSNFISQSTGASSSSAAPPSQLELSAVSDVNSYSSKVTHNNRILPMRSSALETSNGIRLTFNDDDSILSISNVQVSHSGNYTCIVSNEAATVTYSSFLHVNGEYLCKDTLPAYSFSRLLLHFPFIFFSPGHLIIE